MAKRDVDLFVIGAGSGGVRAARIASGYGARVMIAEEFRVGGTCVIRGCVPKKLLVYASRFGDDFEDAVGFGWTAEKPVFHWPTLIANKDREIARLEAAYTTTLERFKVSLVKSRAVLASGTILTGSTPVYDLVRGEIYQRTHDGPLEIPAGAVVVPGARAVSTERGRDWGLSLYAAIIVKYRDEKTDTAVRLEDYLR